MHISNSGDTNQQNDQQDKLSTNHKGAIIGGSIGGIAAVAIVGSVVWWFCVKKRKPKQPSTGGNEYNVIAKPELQSPPDRGKHELGQGLFPPKLQSPPDRGRHELRQGPFPPELQSPPDRGKHELGQGLFSPEGRAELDGYRRAGNNPNAHEI